MDEAETDEERREVSTFSTSYLTVRHSAVQHE